MSVVASRQGRVGHLLLDRPKALNALDLGMIRSIAAALDAWRDDPGVHAVVIQGAGGRAFCAGGDIRLARQHALAGEWEQVETFFAEEYALNQHIATYPKPYVALIDGICMGGGIGVSVHGVARPTTQAGSFAMPETAIALFPDVGATYLLPRLRGYVGLYLALTGARLAGADAAFAGLATHLVTPQTMAALPDALAEHGMAALGGIGEPVDAPLARNMAAIDRCFSAPSVAAILDRLATEGEWGEAAIAAIRAASPSAVLWTFDIVKAGAGRTLAECLAAELALTRTVTRHPDFHEGVRAMVVDKDRQPRWHPGRIEDVDPAATQAMFGG